MTTFITSPSAYRSRKLFRSPRTLAIDIGGSGIKAIVLDAPNGPVSQRLLARPRRKWLQS
jgi:hypothetical protein